MCWCVCVCLCSCVCQCQRSEIHNNVNSGDASHTNVVTRIMELSNNNTTRMSAARRLRRHTCRILALDVPEAEWEMWCGKPGRGMGRTKAKGLRRQSVCVCLVQSNFWHKTAIQFHKRARGTAKVKSTICRFIWLSRTLAQSHTNTDTPTHTAPHGRSSPADEWHEHQQQQQQQTKSSSQREHDSPPMSERITDLRTHTQTQRTRGTHGKSIMGAPAMYLSNARAWLA